MTQNRTWPSYSMPRCSGLFVFVVIYISLFAVVGIVLFSSLFQLRKTRSTSQQKSYPVDSTSYEATLTNDYSQYYMHVSRDLWNVHLFENETRIFNATHNSTKSIVGLRWPYSNPTLVNCTTLQEITELEFVAAGWTKAVFKGRFRGKDVALKTVNTIGHDIQECQKDPTQEFRACYHKSAAKILKEIIMLTELAHDNIVKVFGFCIPETGGPITLVTELGEPLDSVRLLQLTWEDRLRLVLGIAHVLHHLANSPLGSLSMNDFRRQQFVTVDGVLKLSDVDDLGTEEPGCETDIECSHSFTENTIVNSEQLAGETRIPTCSRSICQGHNTQLNIWRAWHHFVRLLLPISAPVALEPLIQELMAGYGFRYLGREWDTSKIVATTEKLVDHFRFGQYMHKNEGIDKLGFEVHDNSDLPGEFDYPCRHSSSAVSCVMSVYNDAEAAQFCARDEECKAVVLSQQQTWTGRTVAILKNGFCSPSIRKGFKLLLKKKLS